MLNRLADRMLRRPSRLRVSEVSTMSDVPKSLARDHIYLVGPRNQQKWAIMACPCGCGDRIDVNLMRARRPAWPLKWRRGEVDLSPSLWRPKSTCGSHFWLRGSRIVWVGKTNDWAVDDV